MPVQTDNHRPDSPGFPLGGANDGLRRLHPLIPVSSTGQALSLSKEMSGERSTELHPLTHFDMLSVSGSHYGWNPIAYRIAPEKNSARCVASSLSRMAQVRSAPAIMRHSTPPSTHLHAKPRALIWSSPKLESTSRELYLQPGQRFAKSQHPGGTSPQGQK